MNNTHGDILHNTTDAIYRVKPEELTGGPSQQSCNNYRPHYGEVGWICPVCGRGLAPSTSYCPCNLTRNITYLNGGVTIKDRCDAIDCNSISPEAYYTTTATNATNKRNGGVYVAHCDEA